MLYFYILCVCVCVFARTYCMILGIARSSLNMKSGEGGGGWSGGAAILSELGTLQLEFRYLAHHIGDPAMEAAAMKGIQLLARRGSGNGLYPIKIGISDGGFADSMITFGALGDSFYEYLLKTWLQGDRKEGWLRDMYDKAIENLQALDNLYFKIEVLHK